MTAVTSFSWLAQRKSCYGIVNPRRCCKNPPLSLPLWLHLPSSSVLPQLLLLPCIGHVSCRLHFQVSSIVIPYVMYHLSRFTKTYPLGFDQPMLSVSASLKLSPLYFPELPLCLLVASYRHLVHHFINFLDMAQHSRCCCDAFSGCLVRCWDKPSPMLPHIPATGISLALDLSTTVSSKARTPERQRRTDHSI